MCSIQLWFSMTANFEEVKLTDSDPYIIQPWHIFLGVGILPE